MKKLSDLAQQMFAIAYDFRQLLVILAVLGISVKFRLIGMIDGTNFTDIIKSTVMSFFAVRGVEHCTSAYSSNQPSEPSEPSDG